MRRGTDGPGDAFLPPDVLTRVADLEIMSRRVVEGFLTGLHRSSLRGFSTEFDQYRPYSQGDDLKHVDWKIYARTDRFFVKEYEADRNVDVILLVDASASMGYAGAGLSKIRYASMLAACLAYLLLRQRDRVGLQLAAGAAGPMVEPRCRAGHLQRILAALHSAQPAGEAGLPDSLRRIAARRGPRGMVVLVSDLYDEPDELAAGLALLRHVGHETLVFHLIDRSEREFRFRGATEFVDMETGRRLSVDPGEARAGYLQRMGDYLQATSELCAAAGAAYVILDPSEPLARPLAAFLAARSGRRRTGAPWR